MAVQYIYNRVDDFSILATKSGICEVDGEEMVMAIMQTIIKKKREFDGYAPLNVYIARGMKKQTAKITPRTMPTAIISLKSELATTRFVNG